jgi:predicted kinase
MNTTSLPTPSLEFLSHAFDWHPPLQLLTTCPQDAEHHAEGDVWTHTQMVIHALLEDPIYQSRIQEEQLIAFYACLLHDVAKPPCTRVENGKLTSAGHSKRGAQDIRLFLYEQGVPFHIRESICQIVAHHQVPFFSFAHASKSPTFLAHELSWKMPLHLLLDVARADMRGRVSVHQKECLDTLTLFELVAEEQQCLYAPYAFPDEVTRMKYFASAGTIDPRFPFFQTTRSVVHIMSGLPASGKDTFVHKHFSHLPVISFDDAIASAGLHANDNVGVAIHGAIEEAKQLLRDGREFVFNATHLSPLMRQKTLDLVHRYDGVSHLHYLEVPYDQLFTRNQARDTTLSNKKLASMMLKWETPTPIESFQFTAHTNTPLLKPKHPKSW